MCIYIIWGVGCIKELYNGSFLKTYVDAFIEGKNVYVPLFVFCVVVIVSIVFFAYNKFKKNRKYTMPTYWFFTVGAFVSVFLLFLFEYCSRDSFSNPFFSTVVSAVKIFTFGYDWQELGDVLMREDGTQNIFLYKLLVIVSAAAPLLTANAVMVALGESLAILKSKVTIISNLHIFSELNEKSICLAEDIYRERGLWPVKIIFTNTDKESMIDVKNDFAGRVKYINGLTTRKSVLEMTSRLRLKKTKYYLISADETHNVENCISLYDKVKENGDEIYVFSTLDSTEVFIDSIVEKNKPKKKDSSKNGNKGNSFESVERYETKFFLVNEAKIATYNLLLKHPLYSGADRFDEKEIFVVVIGGSRTAREFIKASLWCGQMKEFTFKMKIIDNGDLENEFNRLYGDLKEKAGDAGINLNYEFVKADLNTGELVKALEEQCSGANYFLVSTEDDELTMNISEMVRINVSRKRNMKQQPVIVPIIGNIDYYQIAKSFEAVSDDIRYYPTGCYFDIYKKKYITNSSIIRLSRAFNIFYNIKSLCDDTEKSTVSDFVVDVCGTKQQENLLEICEASGNDIFKLFVNDEEKSIKAVPGNVVKLYNALCELGALINPKDGSPANKIKIPTWRRYKRIKTLLDDLDEKTEVEKQSNMASVIHIFYKLRDVGLEVVSQKKVNHGFKDSKTKGNTFETDFKEVNTDARRVSKKEITEILSYEQIINDLIAIEHNRWVVFQLMDGWVYYEPSDFNSGTQKCKHKDEARKLHVCIASNDKLIDLAQGVYADKYRFIKNDYIPIKIIKIVLFECLNCNTNPVLTLLGVKTLRENNVEQYPQRIKHINEEIPSEDITKYCETNTVKV